MTEPGYVYKGAAELIASKFHEAYERLAPEFGYATREASAKPWSQVPQDNRRLMTAVVRELLGPEGCLDVRFPGDAAPHRADVDHTDDHGQLRTYTVGRVETRTLSPQAPHRYRAGHSGVVCDAMVLLADETGDSCGVPFAHPIHDVACTCPVTDPIERARTYTVAMLGMIEPHAVGCPRHGYPNGVSRRCMRCFQVDGNHIPGCAAQ